MAASAVGAFLVLKKCAGESGSSGADTETNKWLQHLICWCFSLVIKARWCSFPLQRGRSPRGNLRPLPVLMQMHPWGIGERGHSARLTASLRFVFSPQEIAAWVLSVRTRNQIKSFPVDTGAHILWHFNDESMIWEQNKPRGLHVANVHTGVEQTSGCRRLTMVEGESHWKMYCT